MFERGGKRYQLNIYCLSYYNILSCSSYRDIILWENSY
jgi:hypothetical protein